MNDIKRRTIMIFPEFENIDIINEIRKKYDPLASHVRPHVTLAFTFESSLKTAELKEHLVKVLGGIKPFRMVLQGIVKVDNPLGMYMFLDVKEGCGEIKKISQKLYTGILQAYKPDWFSEKTFMPHMTIGEFTSRDDLNRALKDTENINDSFCTIVNKISVEIIDKNEDSNIEMEINLNN